jgi:hypothetical protein
MPYTGLPASEAEQQRFFERMREGFAAAVARAGELVFDLSLAETLIRLRFAGPAMLPNIVPGLAHCSAGSPHWPACEVCIWDSESSGIAPAPRPRPQEDLTGRGAIWGFRSSRFRSAYRWVEGSVSLLDRQERQAIYWVPSYRHVPAWALSAPLRGILHWWMEQNGRQLIHAAAVGYAGRGVLLPGRGGSGKSSTALACLEHGLDFVSDDYVALALDPQPRAFRLYATAKVDPRSLDLYPEVARRSRTLVDPGFDKVVLFLENQFSSQLRDSLPVEQVLQPVVCGSGQTRLGPIDAPAVERALAAETLAHLPHTGNATVQFLERIAQELPRATLLLGPGRADVANTIREILTSTPAVTPLEPLSDAAAPTFASRPYISLVLLREPEGPELEALAASVAACGYPRTELLVTHCGADLGRATNVSALPGTVHLLPFDGPVPAALAWNRAIREAFASLLFFIEPGDRLADGALEALAGTAAREPHAAWFTATLDDRSLRGALVRKSAFERCGLFDPNLLLAGREQQEWIAAAARMGLAGFPTGFPSLRLAARGSGREAAASQPGLREIKAALDRRRKAAESA